MGLVQSLYTGWSGMATHQKALDNTGNNLANVSTVGYRKSDFLFSNLFSQLLNGGGYAAETTHGTTNPMTLGVGVTTGAITPNQKQGPIEYTGNSMDVAINGNGFFVVQTGYGSALTRNGSFYLDSSGPDNSRFVCTGTGLKAMGWQAVDGVVTPSTTVSTITVPAIGSIMPGKTTSNVALTGILPTNTSSAEFAGASTTSLELKGNLTSGGSQSLETTIYLPVSESGAAETVQPVKVRLDFTSQGQSAEGSTNDWGWTMTTVDWPSAGAEGVRIYPASGSSGTSPLQFAHDSDPAHNQAAGQPMANTLSPGASSVSTTVTLPDGSEATYAFSMPGSFSLDISHMTGGLTDAPSGELDTWAVNGNPAGTFARSITIRDACTGFESTTDENGNVIMQAVSTVEARQDTLYFTRDSADTSGSHWSWASSIGGQGGTIDFDTFGDYTDATGTSGRINYDLSGIISVGSAGALAVSSEDGYAEGVLQSVSIDQYGRLIGSYSNDNTQILAQLALGTVANTSGLEGVDGSLFYAGPASGNIMIGVAGDAETGGTGGMAAIGAGYLATESLEGSNVDLSQEFTSLISIQRAYQLNAKTVTTSDEMLQTLVGLK